jgi:putrescine---pyruvate transaminase
VQGAGGVIIPPATYWPEIQRICDKYGILLIADEVITGFGRTGNWFGSQTFGIRPHIMTIAKGLSSGYQPIGGSIVCDEVAEGHRGRIQPRLHLFRASGGGGGGAGKPAHHRGRKDHRPCARRGPPLSAERWHALTDHPLVGEAKLVGLMGSIALTPDKESRAKFAPSGHRGLSRRERCFANNLIMRHVYDRMIIAPPLVITPAEIDILIERAWKSLDECHAILKTEGMMKAA